MPLHPNLPIPERILSVGYEGTGKTTNWLNILKWAVRTHADIRFYVGDSDASVLRNLISYPECVPYITVTPLYDWSDYTNFLNKVQKEARPLQDWVVVDFVSNAWQTIQAHFANEVFHKDLGDYFLQARKELSKDASSLGALDGWVDWSVINAMYRKFINPLTLRSNYHLYCTAKAERLSGDKKPTEDKQTRALFVRHGIKAAGQKTLPFQFHTLLLNAFTSRGDKRTITTVKDKERLEVAGLEVTNFTVDYLVNIAGWSLA